VLRLLHEDLTRGVTFFFQKTPSSSGIRWMGWRLSLRWRCSRETSRVDCGSHTGRTSRCCTEHSSRQT